MQLTVKAKLVPTTEQTLFLKATTAEYIRLANAIVSDCINADTSVKHTSGTVSATLPSALK